VRISSAKRANSPTLISVLAGLGRARAGDEPEEAVSDPAAAHLDGRRSGRELAGNERICEQLGRGGDLHPR
jgi:hypothetical protein